MRIAINFEQLFYRAPGGTGRYAARLASSISAQFSADAVVPFMAWHSKRDIRRVYERSDLSSARLAPPVRLPLPRPALFDMWHNFGFPGPQLFSSAVKGADIVHNPFPAVPPVKGPLVVTVHDAGFAAFPSAYPRRGVKFHTTALENAARRAQLVITDTHAAAREIAAHSPVPAERLRVVPLGVDHRKATQQEAEQALHRYHLEDRPFFLWVGSLEPRKNVGVLVRAFSALVAAGEVPHRLVLAGPLGWLHQGLISDQERAQLGDRLRSLGSVSDADLRGLYSVATLLALPSLHEGFGLPMLEAMVQGAPVVCSAIAALQEVSGGAALLVPPSEVDKWAKALGELALDAERRDQLSLAGVERASQFSWELTAERTHAVYEEILGG